MQCPLYSKQTVNKGKLRKEREKIKYITLIIIIAFYYE